MKSFKKCCMTHTHDNIKKIFCAKIPESINLILNVIQKCSVLKITSTKFIGWGDIG